MPACDVRDHDAIEHYGRRSAYASRSSHGRAGGRCGHARRARAHGGSAELRGAGARAPVEGGAFPHLHGTRAHGGTGT